MTDEQDIQGKPIRPAGAAPGQRAKFGQTFTTAEVEDAVLALHNIPDERRSAFVARVRYLQKSGLLPGSPGPGRRAVYDAVDILQWVIVFALAELGLQPAEIAHAMPGIELKVAKVFADPDDGEDRLLWIRGAWLSRYLQAQAGQEPEALISDVAAANQISVVLREHGVDRVSILNLTAIKRRLANVLPITWPDIGYVVENGRLYLGVVSRPCRVEPPAAIVTD